MNLANDVLPDILRLFSANSMTPVGQVIFRFGRAQEPVPGFNRLACDVRRISDAKLRRCGRCHSLADAGCHSPTRLALAFPASLGLAQRGHAWQRIAMRMQSGRGRQG